MLKIIPIPQRHKIQRQWVEHGAIFFITSIKGINDNDFYDAFDLSIRAFELGHSGARSIFFGYDLARQRARDNARGNHND